MLATELNGSPSAYKMTDRIYTSSLWKESVRLVKLSLTWIRYFYPDNEVCKTGRRLSSH
jgi:hypothetical protein